EWMPVRNPVADRPREAIYRRFDFGTVASVMCLESRLTGRSDEISWFAELDGLAPEQIPVKAMSVLSRVNDTSRTILGGVQERWLAEQLVDSVEQGRRWQVLANQVILARVKPPNFGQVLTQEQIGQQTLGLTRQMIPFSQLGLPLNLDAWDGFPAARDRLYESAKTAGANLVTFTGDTHTAWANNLYDGTGEQRGVELGCTSVTSPGMGAYFNNVDNLGALFSEANPEVDWHDPFGNGYTLVTMTPTSVSADFIKVTDVTAEEYSATTTASFATTLGEDGLEPLTPV
ncbi:MAG: alkaline phosphatase D family protein, partial [Pseudomonadota bacterium]